MGGTTLNGDILSVIAPVFLIALVGFVWARTGRPFDGIFVSEVVTNVAAPALIFSTLTRLEISAAAVGEMALAAGVCIAAFAVIGLVVLALAGLKPRIYLSALMFPNAGNMGLPLSLFAFGERGLAFAVVFFALASALHFVIGPALAMGEFSLGRLVRLPLFHAIVLSGLVMAAGWEVPGWLANTALLLGHLAVPLMLLALGVSLARLQLTTIRRATGLAAVRLSMGFGVGWVMAGLLVDDPAARGVLILQCSMPVAVFNYLFAQKYGGDAQTIASLVLISTAVSFLSLPLLLAAVL